MSAECDKCNEHALYHIELNEKELKHILQCMDITNDEYGPFNSRNFFHKVYKKLKLLLNKDKDVR